MKGRQGRRLRAEGQQLDATVFVGRGGLTDAHVAEVQAQLKTRDLVKVKVSREAGQGGDRRKVGEALALKASAELVEVRGFSVLLARRRARGGP